MKATIKQNIWSMIIVSGIELCFMLCFVASGSLYAQNTVQVSPSSNVQFLVDSNPENTIFQLAAGIYRMQSVLSKNGDIFIGENGTIFNGSRVLADWKKDGDFWVHGGQDQNGAQLLGSWCEDGFSRCHYPEDLYVNDIPLIQQDSKAKVLSENDWFFDQANDQVFIHFNPENKKIEIGVTPFAFSGTAVNVTIKNIIVEKYASPTQKGAIGADGCTDWLIENCETRLNHGVGIHFSGKSVVRNCKIYRNGQLGIKTRQDSDGALIESNEIFENKYSHYLYSNEGGGSKFARTRNLTIRNNYVHHNFGPGLWTDIDNYFTLYEGNVCEYNWAAGIFHEISFDAVIKCNVVRYNNLKANQGASGNIFISNSVNCDVYNNVSVSDNELYPNGITIKFANREAYQSNNNLIHNNDITFKSAKGISGLKVDNGLAVPTGNKYFNNVYHIFSPSYNYFAWNLTSGSLATIQALGQETGSTVDDKISNAFKFPNCSNTTTKVEGVFEGGISVFPNPFQNSITIQGIENVQLARLFDIRGNLVFQAENPASSLQLGKCLVPGLYTLQLFVKDGVKIFKLLNIN